VRSTCDDPLADRHARGFIDEAQFAAGREFQRQFRIAERGPRAVQFSEAVDGNPPRGTLTDSQLDAWKWLAKCYGRLGADGTAIVRDVLISGMTAKQIAERGAWREEWQRYCAKRFWECLNTLAVVYGFSNGETKARSGAKKQNIGAQ
jgi:hypothetical protein